MKTPQLARVSISNILAIEDIQFAPGPFTRVTGGNEVGKTSVLEAIKSVCKGGHDATLLRNGQKKGEVVLEFDSGLTFRRTITEKGSYLKVTDKDGAPVDTPPATFVKGLWDVVSANPVEFVTGTDRQRIDILLESLDATQALEGLKAIGLDTLVDDFDPKGLSAIAALELARKKVYAARADHKRDAKKAGDTAAAIESDLPAQPDAVVTALEIAEGKLEDRHIKLGANCDLARAAAKTKTQAATTEKQAIVDSIDEHLEELRIQYETSKRHLEDKRAAARDEVRNAADAVEAELEASLGILRGHAAEDIDALKAEVTKLQERKAAAAAAEARRTMARTLRADEAVSRDAAEVCDQALGKVLDLKREMLKQLPMEGVDVDPDQGLLTVNGIPFGRLNQASQWAFAILVARYRAGDVGIVCADGFEHLDDANMASFRAMALESGLTFIVVDRGEGPLAITEEGR